MRAILGRRRFLGLAGSDNDGRSLGWFESGAPAVKSGCAVATVLPDAGTSRHGVLSDSVGRSRDGDSNGDRRASPIAELVRVGAAAVMMVVTT